MPMTPPAEPSTQLPTELPTEHLSKLPTDLDCLGGRLALLLPEELDDDQRGVYDALVRTVVPEAAHGGFTARLDDGRFIGPFNAMLRTPGITTGLGAWAAAIARSGLSEDVRQVVILTVGAAWSAAYEVDAHTAAARAAGVPDHAIGAIVRRDAPHGLSPRATAAQRLTAALVHDQAVPDDVYREATAAFGDAGVVAILCLIGQYQTISGILACFEVPVPERPEERP